MKNRKILIVLLAMLLIVSAVGCAAKQPAESLFFCIAASTFA